MNRWQAFLNSLSTPGGNLFLLVLFVCLLLALVVHVLHGADKDSDQVTTVILTTFSGFSGALLQAFKGRSSDIAAQPPNSTSTTSTTTSEPK